MGVRLSRASATNNSKSRRDEEYDDLDRYIWSLHGSRRAQSVPEEAMKRLVRKLEGFVSMDEMDGRGYTISDCCLRSLVKGPPSEVRLAYRAIGLLALTVGAGTDEDRYELMFSTALAVARNAMRESSDTATLVAALQCLAAVSFAGARRPEDTHECMKGVMAVFNPRLEDPEIADTDDQMWSMTPEVLDAAVSAWTVLLSTLVGLNTCPYEGKGTRFPPHHLAKLLESDDLAVRTAAGVVLAMWAEFVLTQHASPKNMQELDDSVSNLAANMKHDQCPDPEETSKIPKSPSEPSVLKVSTWARLVQLSFLKRFLGEDFPKHVLGNPLVREVATVTDDEADELGCDATDGDVHHWHYNGKVTGVNDHGKAIGVIKSWMLGINKRVRISIEAGWLLFPCLG